MVRIVWKGYEPKNQQQENKIFGTVFERYVLKVLEEFFNRVGDEIIYQKKLSDIVDKPSRWYVIFCDKLPFDPLIYRKFLKREINKSRKMSVKKQANPMAYTPIWYLHNVIGKGNSEVWKDILQNTKYRKLEIIRLDKYKRIPDFVIKTREGKIIIVDCKYRSKKYTLATSDIQRLMIYFKILLRTKKEGTYVRKPVFLFNLPIDIEELRGEKKDSFIVDFKKLFMSNYLDRDVFELPKEIISRRKILQEIEKGSFYITLIEWYLGAIGKGMEDTITITVDKDMGRYFAYSEIYGKFYEGSITIKK